MEAFFRNRNSSSESEAGQLESRYPGESIGPLHVTIFLSSGSGIFWLGYCNNHLLGSDRNGGLFNEVKSIRRNYQFGLVIVNDVSYIEYINSQLFPPKYSLSSSPT